jgi:hypothetical protein
MATRADIRDAFTNELLTAAGTYDVTDAVGNVVDTVTLAAEDIGLRDPEQAESLPQIVYHDDYRKVTYNGVGTGPQKVVRDDSGVVQREDRYEYVEAQFIIDVRAANEVEKEPIYEALRRRFARYQFDPWPLTDIHPDADDIDVVDASTRDTGDTEDVIRGDQLEVRIEFHRAYEDFPETIETIVQKNDADNDGTIDETYTTS